MAHIRPKLHNCVKRGFLREKWPILPFWIYHVPSCQNVKKKKICDRSWDIRLNSFGPNWAQILLLLEKGIFWENWLTLLCSTHYATMSQKKKKKKKYWQIMWYKVLKFWAKLDTNHPLTPTKGFFKKTDWYFCLQCLKKSLKWITKYKVV